MLFRSGYFRASPYHPPTVVTPGRDTILAALQGRGHLVCGLVTGHSQDNRYVSCEGDVRVYIDGIATPQVESDGSESWACYGWGFVAPGSGNPASGYDGTGNPNCDFSMTRTCLGDWYPFRRELRFGIEAGDCNNQPMLHSGLLLYYGTGESGFLDGADELDIGNAASEQAHDYVATDVVAEEYLEAFDESGTQGMWLKDFVRYVAGTSEFTIRVPLGNAGVRLRRRSDQERGRQRARVLVDGVLVRERTWCFADRNPYRRWLEDEFEIPAAYTAGKERLRIRLEFVPSGDAAGWSEARYWAFAHALA